MGLLPVMVVFGLSFPPVFLNCWWLCCCFTVPAGITADGDLRFVWHPALFNTALYCCLFYLITCLFV